MLSNATTTIDSVTHFNDYIKKAKECGMKAMGISEHWNGITKSVLSKILV